MLQTHYHTERVPVNDRKRAVMTEANVQTPKNKPSVSLSYSDAMHRNLPFFAHKLRRIGCSFTSDILVQEIFLVLVLV